MSNLVCLHGFSQNSSYFSDQIEYFSSEHEVHSLNLVGHGENSSTNQKVGIGKYAEAVLKHLEENEISQTLFWGTHTGAAVGTYLAAFHQPVINALILEAPVIPNRTPPTVEKRLSQLRATMNRLSASAALTRWLEEAEWFAYMRAHPEKCRYERQKEMVLEFQLDRFFSEETTHEPCDFSLYDLRRIHIPVLLYNGEHDCEDFLNISDELRREIKHTNKHTIPDSGGFPAWENPQAVNELVRAFLRRKGL